MNPKSYFGEHDGRLAPMMFFLLSTGAPLVFYVFFLSKFIPLKWVLIFELPWAVRMALYFLGNEPKKLEVYKQSLNNQYDTADDLVKVSHIYPDGMIEYTNGMIVYIISGYFMTYIDDDSLSIDIEDFLDALKGFTYDISLHNVIDEFKLQNNMEGMRVYTDKELMQERMEFYIQQDDFCHDNALLYRINFEITAPKYSWKETKMKLEEIVNSDITSVFKEVYICNEEEVSDVMSRDTCMNVDLKQLLVKKYQNENYYGSKVLFYGDEVPVELQAEKEVSGIENRRVGYK